MEDRDRTLDWTKSVGIPDEHTKVRKNVTQACFRREIGRYNNKVPSEFLWAAEDKLVDKNTYEELKCQLPDSPRSTFLMVFSPDGKKVASTHGNHNVYVTDLRTGKNIQTLSGHPRTPWCIAFHPSSNQILASGCLAGQVRVWDLNGGSEVWTAESKSVIASLAFHPTDRMLVIATYNELHFWDWSQSKPFAKCSTKSEKEKVRYVSFDRLGNKLITGIANPVNTPPQWDRVSVVHTHPPVTTVTTSTTIPSTTVTTTSSSQNQGRSVTYSNNYLMNQYWHLVRRYIDLSGSRNARTIDRGTDPMDFVDVQNLRGQNESSRTSSSTSTFPPNVNRSVRYRIMRSTCRSYRPPSSRERFRIHSSLLSGLPSRPSTPPNTLVRTTTTTTTTSQSIVCTTTAAISNASSMLSQLSWIRPCGFSVIAGRPLCLTVSRENLPNFFSVRSSQPPTAHSGAVTNPTYTSYSERGIFSTRETNSGDSDRPRVPLVRPYRIVLDDINHIRPSVHAVVRPSNEEHSNRTTEEQRVNTISPLDRRDRQRSHMLDVEEVEIGRESQVSDTAYVSPFRRLSSDSESTSTTPTNTQRPSPQQWVSHNTNHLPLHPRPVPRFQFRPTFDLNDTSPVRRTREDTDSESSTNTTPSVEASSSDPATSNSMSPVQLHAVPVSRLQIRPRYLQDQPAQLSNNPEAHSSSQSNQCLRRQFVLSRHSNSPFQPRVPHRIDSTITANPAVAIPCLRTARPEIPSCMSSFVASGTSNAASSAPSVSLPVCNAVPSSSRAVNTATTTTAGDESVGRGSRETPNRLRFFDHVKLLLRDRIRNSSEHASTDSTVNYSNISNESEGEARNMDSSLEEGNSSSVLGPRGLDPMLSSVGDNSNNGYDSQLFPSSSNAAAATNTRESSSNLNTSNADYFTSWDSGMDPDTDAVPFSSSSFPVDPVGSESNTTAFPSSRAVPGETASQSRETENPSNPTASGSGTRDNATELSFSFRENIQILNLHIENMQRLCRARIEIIHLQQIRLMWEELITHIRSLNAAVNSNSSSRVNSTASTSQPAEENESSSSSRGSINTSVNHMERIAISDKSPTQGTSTSQSIESNENFYSYMKDIIDSMLNALSDNKNSSGEAKPETSNTKKPADKPSQSNETDEPQPGPSSSTSHPERNCLKYRIFKSMREKLNRASPSNEPESSQASSSLSFGNDVGNRSRTSESDVVESSPPKTPRTDFYRSTEVAARNNTPDISEAGSSRGLSNETSNACQSCGNKNKTPITSGLQKQKKKCTEATSKSEPGGSSSKMMKNNLGDRVAPPTSAGTTNPPPTNPTSELLKDIIERMEIMVEFQRVAFRRTEELTESSRGANSESQSLLHSSDESDNDNVNEGQQRSVYIRNLVRSNNITRQKLLNLRYSVTQYRARHLLNHMVKSLTKFFTENSGHSSNVLDEQLISLYTLLHLALELTDLLLDQLNATREDIERSWIQDGTRTNPSEARNPDLLTPDQIRVLRRLGDKARRLIRSSVHSNNNNLGRGESRRVLPNPFLRSRQRTGTFRLCSNQHENRSAGNNTGCSFFCQYRPSRLLFAPNLLRSRRNSRLPSVSLSEWYNSEGHAARPSSQPSSNSQTTGLAPDTAQSRPPRSGPQPRAVQQSRISNGNSNNSNQFRYFRLWRNNNEQDSEQNSRVRSDTNNADASTSTSSLNNNDDDEEDDDEEGEEDEEEEDDDEEDDDEDTTNNNNNNNSNSNNNNNINNNNSDNDSGSNNNASAMPGSTQNNLPFSTYFNIRERPMVWIRYGGNNDINSSSSANDFQSRESNFTVPVVHVNDIPVQDISMLNQPRHRPQSPTPRDPEDLWRWRAWRPRFLHPRYIGPHPFDDQDSNELPEGIHYYRWSPNSGGLYTIDPVIIADGPMSPHHRIQAWDFSKMHIPDISDREANGVVAECKIHNDASVDVSNDGHLLVTLLPSGRFSVTTMLGVYSLDWSSLGQLLYKTSFEQNAVSVSLSPTNRHLLVGLASRPLAVRDRTNMAQIFRLEGAKPAPPGGSWQSSRGRLVHMRDLEQTRETNIMSLNCIRWAPGAGQGLVYGTNTGQLKVLR